MPDYTLTVYNRWTGETVGTFRHQPGDDPDDAFESIAMRGSGFPGVDNGLPADAFRTELYGQYCYGEVIPE